MIGALRRWFIKKPPEEAIATYIALVKAARNPFFYTALQVPDTLDGRFELIVLHLFLLQHRLVVAGETNAPLETFARYLSEEFFRDMDRSLRELGVADTGVSHRIKKMGKAYHGRLQAYAAGLQDRDSLRAALARNLYGTVPQGDVALLDQFAEYVEKQSSQLAATESGVILSGRYQWPGAVVL